ncbi:alpha/beta hydrolase [Kitasatospora sp. CM 4170]|uniref:Alpha/beta hydrolase n=1 Tax=Kitasatospora aburaviensis TaxID=67265 RepID=A0ABW1F9N9_9ACTN|nr:alpha/beta hydrolase [Kitasatospora sp. CM 4170]WNM43440.1 alpha/beta hydrolase [Kitasatospora sp. CM 4170]
MTHDFLMSRRTVTTSLLAGSAALLVGAGGRAHAAPRATAAAPTPGDLVLTLPAPTGRHRVGCQPVYLVDGTRRDPWDPAIPVRELMLTVFYPARDVTGPAPAPQMPPQAATWFGRITPLTPLHLPAAGVNWGATRSHAFEGASPLPGRWPVLVHSPGGGDPRGLGTSLAEDLASHGAVVISVDHPGDAAAVEFPDAQPYRTDTVRTTVLRGDPRDRPAVARTMIDARIADLHCVLDRLGHAADLPLPRGLAETLDLRRLGVYGHSAGGSAVTEVMYEDRRVRAGINLEGYLDYPPSAPGATAEPFPVTAVGVDRPLLLLGSEGFNRREELDRSWSAVTALSGRWVHSARVAGANHWIFTDFAAMLPRLQAAGLMTAAERNALIGTVGPTVSVPKVRHTIRRFFARHLAGH